MKLQAMIGYKIYKINDEDDSVTMLRIKKVREYKDGGLPAEITVIDESDGETKKIRVEDLKEYTPLEPDGVLTFSIVKLYTDKEHKKYCNDVIVTGSRILDLKLGDLQPYCICRQNINDIFYNMLVTSDENCLVGLSINKDTCPSNFDFDLMLACDEIVSTEDINFYRNDTLEDIYKLIKIKKYDDVLNKLYSDHITYSKRSQYLLRNQDQGWCKDLKTLLDQNAFQADLNQMLNITEVDFKLSDYFVTKKLPNDEEYTSLEDDLILWMDNLYHININEITVIEYNHDINMGDFNDTRYFLMRDSDKKLYLVVYTLGKEYHEADLKAAAEKQDFSTKFKLAYMMNYTKNGKK